MNKIIVKGSKIAEYSNKLGKILLGLSLAETGINIVEACKANPESPLCAQAAVQDSAGFGGGVIGGALDSKADGEVSLGEFLGCNVALDAETVGAGFFVCTATIWAGTGMMPPFKMQ